jgi:methyl coenzyme M reductase beta subunit
MAEVSDRKIDLLIDQVGRLTESIHELKEVSIAQNQAIQRVADQHEQTVTRLITVVEALLHKDQQS